MSKLDQNVSSEKSEKMARNESFDNPEEESLLQDNHHVEDANVKEENNHVKKQLLDAKVFETPASDRRLSDIALELYYKSSDDITCGIGYLRGKFLQRFANKKFYILIYGILGCVMNACASYTNGTITTIEKRFKIPSKAFAFVMVGAEIGPLTCGLLINYYGDRGHRPRWIASGVFSMVAFCILSALPHLLYGPGTDALALTREFGGRDSNDTARLVDAQNRMSLCQSELDENCVDSASTFAPLVIMFIAQLIRGIGCSIYYTLGIAYMDDNVKRSKAPALVSLSYFMAMLGPALGYTLSSACLTFYISPELSPTISIKDPRWLGAWWLGWLVLGGTLFFLAILMMLFPRALPRAAARKIQDSQRRAAGLAVTEDTQKPEALPTSMSDLAESLKRLMRNKTLMYNNLASVFYLMGYMPYWIFMPKYIETIYKKSASSANFITGAVGLSFSAFGILLSGAFISKFKPGARYLAAWNFLTGFSTSLFIASYALLGCPVNDRQGIMLASGQMETTTPCNQPCHCDFVKYTPVCSPDGRTFISPCHAGCSDYITINGSKVFTDCTCVKNTNLTQSLGDYTGAGLESLDELSGYVSEGACPTDCDTSFYIFLIIVCINKFIGATSRTSNFLVSVRCVDNKDKTLSMALGMIIMSTFAFLPSPILFGYIIDTTCMVWGKTCSGTGNCWIYNPDKLKTYMNFTAAAFIVTGSLFDIAVLRHVKDLKIFDEEEKLEDSKHGSRKESKNIDKKEDNKTV